MRSDGCVDGPKTTRDLAQSVVADREKSRAGHAQVSPVEDVHELSADLNIHALRHPKIAADIEILLRPALRAEIPVAGVASPLAIRRIDPSRRIQHLIGVWIDAMAVEILEV